MKHTLKNNHAIAVKLSCFEIKNNYEIYSKSNYINLNFAIIIN